MVNAIVGLILGFVLGMILGALSAENRYLKLLANLDKRLGGYVRGDDEKQ